jgi:hypothetical protein
MTYRPLGLSDAQLELVVDGAYIVPPRSRGRYLADIVRQLRPLRTITDADVQDGVSKVLRRMGIKAA